MTPAGNVSYSVTMMIIASPRAAERARVDGGLLNYLMCIFINLCTLRKAIEIIIVIERFFLQLARSGSRLKACSTMYTQPITFVQMERGRTVEVDVHQR